MESLRRRQKEDVVDKERLFILVLQLEAAWKWLRLGNMEHGPVTWDVDKVKTVLRMDGVVESFKEYARLVEAE